MYFKELIKRLTIDFFFFISAVLGLIFLCTQMISFISAAVALKMINVQIVTYTLYTFLLTAVPIWLLTNPQKISKRRTLGNLFYALAAVIAVGAMGDMISYRGFVGYVFSEGDAVFVNLLWNIPNLFGIVLSLFLAAVYVYLGGKIRTVRRASYTAYLCITLIISVLPFAYSFAVNGDFPRKTWLEKSVFIIPMHLSMLTALSVAVSSRKLWTQHIW